MQKLNLSQSLSQKLSPQQIQFIKLLQVPTAELEARIEEELEINPALEEGREEEPEAAQEEYEDSYEEDQSRDDHDVNLDDYLDDEYGGYKMQGDGNYNSDEEDREMPISSGTSLHEQLISQLGFLKLDEHQRHIGIQLIGSIENDGYIRRDLDAIINDLAFSQNIETDYDELEEILRKIQTFDPAGIASRNLQECLTIQLERKEHPDDPTVQHAIMIIHDCFEEFTKKHYSKIQKKCNLTDEETKEAVNLITKLNPKPGGASEGLVRTQYIIPDFMLTNNNGKMEITLNSRNAPELRISRSYADMFDAYDKSDKKDKKLKETVTFVKQKLDSAKWFIDAIKQRQNTLLRTMEAILVYQKEFFLDGDETNLRPMILKDIAERIDMDISTVSRVANSKAIQTEFGVYPLKYFFSEGIATDSGEDVSNREVKSVLQTMVDAEDKKRPLSDDKLVKMLNKKGYNIARRTVAKYREQLQIPVARLRKRIVVLKYSALVISVVFQPLLIPTLVFGLILYAVPEATSIPSEFKDRIFFLIVLSTLLIPMITIIGLRLSGTLKSLHMDAIQDRVIPFSITSAYYLLTVYFLYQKIELDPILWQALSLITIAVIGLTGITFFWKMSAHMTGAGGLLAVILVLGFKFHTFAVLYPLILCLLLIGAIGSSRLYLGAHKPIEIYGGMFFGFLICYLGFNLIWA